MFKKQIWIGICAFMTKMGAARLAKDISLMIGHDIPQIWKYMWLYVTPPLMIFLLIFMLVQHESVQYGTKPYPSWSIGVGWIISLIPISVLVLGTVHTFCTLKGSFKQRLQTGVRPSKKWNAIVLNDEESEPNLVGMSHRTGADILLERHKADLPD